MVASEYPYDQNCYEITLSLLQNILDFLEPYAYPGWDGDETIPQYVISAANNLVENVHVRALLDTITCENLTLESQTIDFKSSKFIQTVVEKVKDISYRMTVFTLMTHVVGEKAVSLYAGNAYLEAIRTENNQLQISFLSNGCEIFLPNTILENNQQNGDIFQIFYDLNTNFISWGQQNGSLINTCVGISKLFTANGSELTVGQIETGYVEILLKEAYVEPSDSISFTRQNAITNHLFVANGNNITRNKRRIKEVNSYEEIVVDNKRKLYNYEITIREGSQMTSPLNLTGIKEFVGAMTILISYIYNDSLAPPHPLQLYLGYGYIPDEHQYLHKNECAHDNEHYECKLFEEGYIYYFYF